MKTMRALVICPYEHSIKEVEVDDDNLQTYYDALSAPGHPVDTFDVVRCDGFDVYVDDIGLMRDTTSAFFDIDCYPQPLAGRGLVLGKPDRRGYTTPATLSVEELKKKVNWLTVLA